MLKIEYILFHLFYIALFNSVFSQINNTGNTYNIGDVFINGYKINNGTLFNSGSIYIGGDLTNNGTTDYNGGNIIFNGSSTQTISGTNTFSTTSTTFNNTTGISVNKCLSINSIATFSNGLITTPTGSLEPVEFNTGASHANVSNSSHVDGYVRKLGTGSFTYPVGDVSTYQKVAVNPTANATGLVVKYFPTNASTATFNNLGTDPTPLLYYNKLEYWDITPVSSATGSVTIYWDNYRNEGIGSVSDLKVAHKIGGFYLNEGTSGTGLVSSGNVTSNSISTWSLFALGSTSSNSPLPITLTSFSSDIITCHQVNINWHVALEINLNHYELQFSLDAQNFKTISNFIPKGNNSSYKYSYVPENNKIGYFRLKIIDNDHTYSYSPIIYENTDCLETRINVFPNVTGSVFTIQTNDVNVVGYELYDSKGSLVLKNLFSSYIRIDINSYAQDLYHLSVISSDGIKNNFKIIKTD